VKRGTNYNLRARLAHLAAVECAEVAAVAHALRPLDTCGDCGHPASDHDTDKQILLPGQRPGGCGCLHGWTKTEQGCHCAEFEPWVAAQ
jgi:hypothetical protein